MKIYRITNQSENDIIIENNIDDDGHQINNENCDIEEHAVNFNITSIKLDKFRGTQEPNIWIQHFEILATKQE